MRCQILLPRKSQFLQLSYRVGLRLASIQSLWGLKRNARSFDSFTKMKSDGIRTEEAPLNQELRDGFWFKLEF